VLLLRGEMRSATYRCYRWWLLLLVLLHLLWLLLMKLLLLRAHLEWW
jgi:hypothetical protein